MVSVVALQTHNRRRRRAQHADAFVPRLLEPLAQNSRPLQRLIQLVAAHQNISQRAVRRIVHPTAKAQFLFIEADKVVLRRILHRVVIWKIRLQHNFTRSLPATRASRDLSQQLKRTLRRAKIREPQSHIGPDYAHQRDPMNVMTLGDHLRAYQQVKFAFVQRIERALKIFVAPNRVPIKPTDARLRKQAMEQLLQLLGPRPEKINVLAATLPADLWPRRHEPA